jgi:aromatic amino acid permease
MMGLGSAIGAGLFLGSGLGIAAAGPAVLLSYAIAGAIVVLVMRMLAEMASALPSSGSFSVYAEAALGRWAGFLLGWLYWFTIVMVLGVEITGVAGIVHGWWPAVPQWAVAAVIVAVFGAVNLVGVRQFGEAEFWFATIKVAAIIGFLVLGVLIVTGVVPVAGSVLGDWAAHGGFAPAGLPGIAAGLLTVVFAFGGRRRSPPPPAPSSGASCSSTWAPWRSWSPSSPGPTPHASSRPSCRCCRWPGSTAPRGSWRSSWCSRS